MNGRGADFFYRIFGLRVRSNRPLPGLELNIILSEIADLRLRVGTTPAGQCAGKDDLFYVSTIESDGGQPAFRIWKNSETFIFRMDYFDGAQFWLDPNGGAIWMMWREPSSSFEDSTTYLLGPVLGFWLRLKGVVSLHASAVVRDGRAVAFVGVEGAGKSTTAAAMAFAGHAVLSDDIVALAERDGQFLVLPAFPYLSLWQDSARALCGDDADLSPFSAKYEKRRLSLADKSLVYANEPVPLDAIYVLGERSADSAAPFVEEIDLREALMSLVANTYANLLLDEEMRAREFKLLGRLVASVPVRRLHAHRDSSRIKALCELIQRGCEPVTDPGSVVLSRS